MGVRTGLVRLAACCAAGLLVAFSQGCGADSAADQRDKEENAASRASTEQGRLVVRAMLGLSDSADTPTSDPAHARARRYESTAQLVLLILDRREPGALAAFGQELASRDPARVVKAFPAMRQKLDAVAGSVELKNAARKDAAFTGVEIRTLGATGSLRILADPPVAGIPDLGRGADGKFGDGREGALAAAADSVDMAVDPFTPWRTLESIDRGEVKPDPESRLGAYAATGGYPVGSVGEAVHRAIGGIYIALGNYGQENIGRVFNSAEAKALYNQPVESQAGMSIAQIEERYWQNVRAEDGWSPGGQLGSAFSPSVRDFLQRNVFSTGPMATGPGGGAADGGTEEELNKTDCGDKSDGWWCLDAGVGPGWMAYCSGKQVAGGCGCGACTTAGTRASCNTPPPPAACTE